MIRLGSQRPQSAVGAAGIAGKILSYQPDELSTFKQELEQQEIRDERPGGLLGLGVLRVKGM